MPTNLNSEKYEKFFRALFVGATGRGKTIAAASWPGKTLIIDFDGRHRPVIGWYPDRVKAGDFIVQEATVVNFRSEFTPLFESLTDYNPYDNIILDGITTFTETIVEHIIMDKDKGKLFKADKDKGGKTIHSITVPSWDEFNAETRIVGYALGKLMALKCNLIVTAHPIRRTSMEKGKGAYSSIVTYGPKVESIIPAKFDECWYFDYESGVDEKTFKETLTRIVYTSPCNDYLEAKTALKAPAKIDFTNKNLYDCVKEYL